MIPGRRAQAAVANFPFFLPGLGLVFSGVILSWLDEAEGGSYAFVVMIPFND
jgi:hypothetical protein